MVPSGVGPNGVVRSDQPVTNTADPSGLATTSVPTLAPPSRASHCLVPLAAMAAERCCSGPAPAGTAAVAASASPVIVAVASAESQSWRFMASLPEAGATGKCRHRRAHNSAPAVAL